MSVVSADLSAYLALSELSKTEKDPGVQEDISSKMKVHARKLKTENPNINFKW